MTKKLLPICYHVLKVGKLGETRGYQLYGMGGDAAVDVALVMDVQHRIRNLLHDLSHVKCRHCLHL